MWIHCSGRTVFWSHFEVLFQLSSRTELPSHATKIFDILVQYLCIEHIDYALELGLQGTKLDALEVQFRLAGFRITCCLLRCCSTEMFPL